MYSLNFSQLCVEQNLFAARLKPQEVGEAPAADSQSEQTSGWSEGSEPPPLHLTFMKTHRAGNSAQLHQTADRSHSVAAATSRRLHRLLAGDGGRGRRDEPWRTAAAVQSKPL